MFRELFLNVGIRILVLQLQRFYILLCMLGFFPIWTLIVLPVAVPAFQNLKRVSRFFNEGAAVISDLDIRTAKLQLMFGLLFSISFFLSGLL